MAKSFLRASRASGSTRAKVARIVAHGWRPTKKQRRQLARQDGAH